MCIHYAEPVSVFAYSISVMIGLVAYIQGFSINLLNILLVLSTVWNLNYNG
jgi:hypothetical protein